MARNETPKAPVGRQDLQVTDKGIGITISQIGMRLVEEQIAGEHNPLPREQQDDIAAGMPLTKLLELHASPAAMYPEAVREKNIGQDCPEPGPAPYHAFEIGIPEHHFRP